MSLKSKMMDICFINGTPHLKTEITNISWRDYMEFALSLTPRKLYKYFPNTVNPDNGRNYSQEALKNNTVYLQSPILFDDPYDSTLCLDEIDFYMARLKHYADLCGFNYDASWDINKIIYEFSLYLCPFLKSQAEWENLFKIKKKENDLVDMTHQVFALKIMNVVLENVNSPTAFYDAFYQALHCEYASKQTDLIKKFRVACFTTNPFSMLMWAHYADSHKGFCVEYAVPVPNEHNIGLLQNLLPVIYSDERVSVLEECLADLKCSKVTDEIASAIYKYGLLTKSIDWLYQNEWRLISLDDMLSDKGGYNCSFFPISKVFLGAKMSGEKRKDIIKICSDRNIPTSCVLPAMSTFAMQECTNRMKNPNCVYNALPVI